MYGSDCISSENTCDCEKPQKSEIGAVYLCGLMMNHWKFSCKK